MTKEVLDSKMMRVDMLIDEMKTNQIQAEILLKQKLSNERRGRQNHGGSKSCKRRRY